MTRKGSLPCCRSSFRVSLGCFGLELILCLDLWLTLIFWLALILVCGRTGFGNVSSGSSDRTSGWLSSRIFGICGT